MVHERSPIDFPRMTTLKESGDIAIQMLRSVLDVFARLDAARAVAIVREDQAIDDRFRDIMRQLGMFSFMLEKPETMNSAFDIVFIAKAIERIGDHVKNIAESVIYIVRGKDVRHLAFDQLERTALSNEN